MNRRTLLAAVPLAILPTALQPVTLEAPKPARLRTFYVPQPPCRVAYVPETTWGVVPAPGLYHAMQCARVTENPDA